MPNPFEKPPMPSPEKPEKEKPKTSDELIKEDKDLRAEFFKLRDKLEGKEISQEEKKKIKERLEEINKKCEPTSKELDSKSEGLYSEIMDISVRKRKGTSDEKWQDTIKKSGEVLKGAEAKLGKMEDMDPNIKKYLEERIKQKREQLGITEAISPEPTLKEEIIEKPKKLEKLKPEEISFEQKIKEKDEKGEPQKLEKLKPEKISFEQKIKEKIKQGEPLSKEDIETWEKIKSQKALEEMRTEVRELREKKQRGEVFSEEEKRRLEMLKLKWDILQRSSEIKKEKPSVEKEKTKKKLEKELEERRKIYAEARKQSREVLAKGKKEKKLKELLKDYELTIKDPRKKYILVGDSEKLKQGDKDAEKRRKNFIGKLTASGIKKEKAEAIYEAELKKAEYEKAKVELGKKLSEQGVEKAEIFKRLILNEREILNQFEVESWPPKEKTIFRKGMEWWMRRGIATRLLISTALVTGVVALVGGFGATAAATYAGYRFVRGFGSVMVGKLAGMGVDKIMSRGIQAQKEAALEKLKTGFNLEKLTETSKELEKILEETAKRERRKLLIKGVTMAAVGAGTAIGLGMLEQAWAGPRVIPETPAKPAAPPAEAPPVEVPPVIPEPTPAIENIVEAQQSDSIWKIIDQQLEANYGQKFTSLNEAQKTYIIDALKDKVAENPESFGLEDIDEIKIGQKIDLTSIFEDKTGIENIFKRAGDLSQAQIEQIEHNNEILRNWLKEHPGQRLTSERVEEILGKGKIMPAAEIPAAEIPAAEAPTTEAPAPEIPAAEAPTTEAPAGVAEIMDLNETTNIKALGLSEGEYKTIQNLTIGKLLEQIPEDKDEAWRIFEGQVPDKEIDLPHHGTYGATEFKKHLKLVDFIRSFNPGEEIKKMTVRQFLRIVGPK